MAGNDTAGVRCGRWVAAAALAGAMTAPPHALAASEGGPTPSQLIDPLVSPVDPRDVTQVIVDVSIRRRSQAPDGQPRRVASDAGYRIERTRTPRGWKTVMHRVGTRRAVVRGASGDVEIGVSSPISRIEDDGDGTRARVFNERGVEVRLPSRARVGDLAAGRPGALGRLGLPPEDDQDTPALPVPGGEGGVWRGLLVAADDRVLGPGVAERRLGPAMGRVRGLDRHVRAVGDETVETLVDARTALIAEVNVLREGQLVERTQHDYVEAAGGGAAKRRVRAERVMPGGERLITEVEFHDIRVAVGGAR